MNINPFRKFKKIFQNFFKKFLQFLFFLIYGRITDVINPLSSEDISIKNINNECNYKIYFVKNGRLYTDRINDTAVILKNKVINGPSYQLRSKPNDPLSARNNASIENNVVFKKGTPRFKKKIKGKVLSLLSGGGANKNYFHWLFDVLPRISILENFDKKIVPDYLLTPCHDLQFQKESLSFLGFNDRKLLSSVKYRHIECDNLIVTDHPYNITGDSDVDHETIPIWISSWLKKKFLKFKKLGNYNPRIYIDRKSTEDTNFKRAIYNEDELKTFLKEHNFEIVKLEEKTFDEQISIFNSAELIIGLHGAGFANISFCKKNTKVIELRSKTTMKVIENIALKNELNYQAFECESINQTIGQSGIIKAPIEEIKKII